MVSLISFRNFKENPRWLHETTQFMTSACFVAKKIVYRKNRINSFLQRTSSFFYNISLYLMSTEIEKWTRFFYVNPCQSCSAFMDFNSIILYGFFLPWQHFKLSNTFNWFFEACMSSSKKSNKIKDVALNKINVEIRYEQIKSKRIFK